MKRMRPMTLLAVVILAGTFLYSAGRLFRTKAAAVVEPGVEVIRFAHWQLEPGVREALRAIVADYMALHPKVRVEQMDIPGRAWKQWLRTQLVGGSPPDLIELASYENPDDVLARYFTPITGYLAEKNPYNDDEPDLREKSWRESYAAELIPAPDGLGHYYNSNLLEYYGAPSTLVTVRIFYNRDLIKAAVGEDRVPKTFEEFVALCAALQHYAQKTGQPITPLGGSVFNITKITGTLFSTLTQRLALDLDYSRNLELSVHETQIQFARGKWSLRSPAVHASLETVESFGRYLPPGWVQLGREDGMLQFLQGRAAMLATGTWDAGGILMQAKFPIGAFKVPAFSRDDPRYGRGTLGPNSEAATFAALPFGLTRASAHPERAIDFLRFLTSRKSNTKFSRISKWLPVIKGVPVVEELKAFEPLVEGYVAGVNFPGMGGSSSEAFLRYLYLLGGNQASADAFIRQAEPIYDKGVGEELARAARITQDTLRQRDSVMTGLYFQHGGELARSKFDRLAASQLDSEVQRLQSLRTLADYPPKE
ncbi:MAG: extracellular solute-binding protein [Opitutaceae bacterium]|jgi:raffinose/stachyose/melibiose transport system substrate-binding protein|nr:extracellular solute-binding protein [Opitutaceae bacterium]MBP9911945.1 extracellular solute-binding protein [Opitutaceae bacterium]